MKYIEIIGANENNLKNLNLSIPRHEITVVTGASGSGKSSLVFDTILKEANRMFFATLSNYSRQFLDIGTRPNVQKIRGLSPAVGLSQNELKPLRRTNIAGLTDIGELLGIIFARYSDKFCPTHKTPAGKQTSKSIVSHITNNFSGQFVAIAAPITVAQKASPAKLLQELARKGYLRAIVNEKILELSPVPELPAFKNTISSCIDFIRVNEKSSERILRSVESGLSAGNGVLEIYLLDQEMQIIPDSKVYFSISDGCAICGYSWPYLDSRYFSPTSLGKCAACHGTGLENSYDANESDLGISPKNSDDTNDEFLPCPDCGGTGLKDQLNSLLVGGMTINQLLLLSIKNLKLEISRISNQHYLENPGFQKAYLPLVNFLERVEKMGLSYLQPTRKIRTLSGGETQRLRLSCILGESLRGVIYVFDEPSQGLHPSEVNDLVQILRDLKAQGSTIICVDHDEQLIASSDWVIDMGPGGGRHGGQILAIFKPADKEAYQKVSPTAAMLMGSGHLGAAISQEKKERTFHMDAFVHLENPKLHNLKIDAVKFPINALTVIAGVSGAGKSSLAKVICGSLKDSFEKIDVLERSSLAASGISFIATYLDIFTLIRELFAKSSEAQILGLSAKDFSFMRPGARCEECAGRGKILYTMKFLPDTVIICPNCNGDRYKSIISSIQFKNLNVAQTLNLTIDDALEHFANFPKIVKRLQPAKDLGLGYLSIGQSVVTLSGGEAQRMRLSQILMQKQLQKYLIILHEPTGGLHGQDVKKLILCVQNLVQQGATVLIIEHHLDVIKSCDWLIELGPFSAEKGGELVFMGPPKGVFTSDLSQIKSWLGPYLQQEAPIGG